MMWKGSVIWKYIQNYKFNSLFIKNFLLILISVVLPLVGVSIGVYGYYGSILREEIGAAHINSLSKVRDMMDMVMQEVDRLSIRIASDREVAQFINLDKEEFPDYYTINILQNISNTISISASDYIDSIYVYSEKSNFILTSTRGGTTLPMFYDRSWMDEYINHKDVRTRWLISRRVEDVFSARKYNTFITSLSFAPLNDPGKGGIVLVNLDVDKLKSLITNMENNQIDNIYILNPSGNIMFSRDILSIGKAIETLPGLENVLIEDISGIKEIEGAKQVITKVNSKHNDWAFISVTPLKLYEQKMAYLTKLMWITISMNMLIAIVVSFIISIGVFKPIKGILALLDNPEKHFLSKNQEKQETLNEFKYITMNILKSFDENKHMEEELSQRMTMLKQAQTAALQSQINPHFLYNTLQTINWLAMGLTKGENEASRVIEALSQILRVTMETESHLIPIRDEMIHAQRYVEILQIRYKNKFELRWDIAEDIKECLIAKVSLQPLIENAIYHGIKPKKWKGEILIHGFMEENHIVLLLIDNGVGMDEEDVCRLNDELANNYVHSDQHIGIRNVNQRLKLIFGEEYGLRIFRREEGGLQVKIMIPKLSEHLL